MSMELWRSIPSLAYHYEASSIGRIRRTKGGPGTWAGRVLTAWLREEYLAVRVSVRGRARIHYAHLLVAEAFHGPKPEGMTVNHEDGDKLNNRPDNLKYMTLRENMRHASAMGIGYRGATNSQAKLTDEKVLEMRRLRAQGWSIAALGRRYGVSSATAGAAIRGQRWQHLSQPVQEN